MARKLVIRNDSSSNGEDYQILDVEGRVVGYLSPGEQYVLPAEHGPVALSVVPVQKLSPLTQGTVDSIKEVSSDENFIQLPVKIREVMAAILAAMPSGGVKEDG